MGFKHMQNISGDSASSWCMAHLMDICANYLELTSSVLFHSSIEFLRKVLSVLLTLYTARYSQIHVCGVELYQCSALSFSLGGSLLLVAGLPVLLGGHALLLVSLANRGGTCPGQVLNSTWPGHVLELHVLELLLSVCYSSCSGNQFLIWKIAVFCS